MTFYEWYQLYAASLWAVTTIVALSALGVSGWLWWQISQMRSRYLTAMAGRDGIDLESLMANQATQLTQFQRDLAALQAAHSETRTALMGQAGNLGVVRYNPFRDTGGDQSFAVAWVNAQGEGVVLSGLYSRDGTRVYAKPLEAGESRYTLTDEEKLAISIAQGAEQSAARA